jgi:hypothetical protein
MPLLWSCLGLLLGLMVFVLGNPELARGAESQSLFRQGSQQQAAPGSPCPDGKPMVACLLNPCQVSKCPNFPQAVCKANYCGGCFAKWFVDGKPVDCGPVDPVW